MADGPTGFPNKFPRGKVDVVVGYAAAAPGPGSSAEGATNGEAHICMPAVINDLGTGRLGDFGVERAVAGFEEQNIVPKLVELRGKCHADWSRAHDAKIADLIWEELLEDQLLL